MLMFMCGLLSYLWIMIALSLAENMQYKRIANLYWCDRGHAIIWFLTLSQINSKNPDGKAEDLSGRCPRITRNREVATAFLWAAD
jgi:hypothetical protein